MARTYPKYGDLPKIELKRVDKMPPTKGYGVLHESTTALMLELGTLEVGEVLYIPIEEHIQELVIREVAKKRYENAFFTCKKHLEPKKFHRVSQGHNIYIERTA